MLYWPHCTATQEFGKDCADIVKKTWLLKCPKYLWLHPGIIILETFSLKYTFLVVLTVSFFFLVSLERIALPIVTSFCLPCPPQLPLEFQPNLPLWDSISFFSLRDNGVPTDYIFQPPSQCTGLKQGLCWPHASTIFAFKNSCILVRKQFTTRFWHADICIKNISLMNGLGLGYKAGTAMKTPTK